MYEIKAQAGVRGNCCESSTVCKVGIKAHRSELTSAIGTITANIVGIMIASRENWVSVANYVERKAEEKRS